MRYSGWYSPLINLLLTYWNIQVGKIDSKTPNKKKCDKNGESLEMVGNGGLFWCSGSVVAKKMLRLKNQPWKKFPRKSRANRKKQKRLTRQPSCHMAETIPIQKKVEEQKDTQQWGCSSQGIHHRTTQQFAQGISKLPWQSWWLGKEKAKD